MNKPLNLVLGAALLVVLVVGTALAVSGGDEQPVHSTGTTTGGRSLPAGAGAVAGRVITPDGQPLAGVLVVPVSLDEPPVAVPERAVVTDAAGRFRWELPAGRYDLRLDGEEVSGSTTVTVRAGSDADVSITARSGQPGQ